MKEQTTVAKILIRNQDNKFLVVKEADSGKWELPGGKIREEEDRFDTASRELREETGLNLEAFEDVVRIELEADSVTNCYVLYTKVDSPAIELEEDELSDFRWVDTAEFLEMDWSKDAGYDAVPMNYLDRYRSAEKDYGNSGREIKVTKALIRNEEGKFLAMKKSHLEKVSSEQRFKKYGKMSGKWELPGGRIGKIPGEDRFEAAKREIKEEAGIELKDGVDVVREEVEELNRVNTYILYFKDWEGEIELSEEHNDYTWVSPEEYSNLNWHKDAGYGLPPMRYLEEYLQKEKNYGG